MLIKITLMVVMVLYAFTLGESLVYILFFSKGAKKMNVARYIELTRLIGGEFGSSVFVIYIILLALSLDLVAFCVVNPAGLLFRCSIISFVVLLTDVLLLVKGNLPLNKRINNWTNSLYPDNWKEIKTKWVTLYHIRKALNMAGFIALLAGAIFGM